MLQIESRNSMINPDMARVRTNMKSGEERRMNLDYVIRQKSPGTSEAQVSDDCGLGDRDMGLALRRCDENFENVGAHSAGGLLRKLICQHSYTAHRRWKTRI